MDEILEKITTCVEFGKVDKTSPFPPDLKGQDGADELTKAALEQGIDADTILKQALVTGMDRVGQKFSEKKIFIPQMLMAAKAMNAAIEHLKPYFQSGAIQHKGEVILATVKGDLHDIGKNLVKMAIEGSGWKVIDLGVDVSVQKIIAALEEHPEAAVGLSALLTTTMQNMQEIVTEIKNQKPGNKILIGGAPVNDNFRNKIGADFYSPDPQGAVKFLNGQVN
ncbi:MAG: corrinoid protein [Bacteroidales bacterium]|jgi:methanogenic corrinoid protein MtbC1|nr:corrinoid protein [Bacteroidales bacterium]